MNQRNCETYDFPGFGYDRRRATACSMPGWVRRTGSCRLKARDFRSHNETSTSPESGKSTTLPGLKQPASSKVRENLYRFSRSFDDPRPPTGGRRPHVPRVSRSLQAAELATSSEVVLLANSRQRSIGRNMSKMRLPGKGKPRFQTFPPYSPTGSEVRENPKL